MTPAGPLLAVRDLTIAIRGEGGPATIVDGLSFAIGDGEFVGLAGESGSGKSMAALSVLGLLPPVARATGRIEYRGQDLLKVPPHRLREIRGKDIAMVFQEPLTSLHPALTIGFQIAEAIRAHESLSGKQAHARAVDLLGRVGIPEPALRATQYPHEFSGGMLQRAMIAMALSCRPRLLIADEPTTALDVTVQAQLMDLLASLHSELGMAVLLISHDLGLLAGRTSRTMVMYAGQLVESGPSGRVFARPASPYTEALLAAIPNPNRKHEPLRAIPGAVPARPAEITGCRFANRCAYRLPACDAPQLLQEIHPEHLARCVRAPELSLQNSWAASTGGRPEDASGPPSQPLLLEATALTKTFRVTRPGGLLPRRLTLTAVDNVSLSVGPGETLGIVGESGSGKSTLARLLLRLVEPTSGSVTFKGRDLAHLDPAGLRTMRASLQAVFQNVTSGLNLRMSIADIVGEPLSAHRGLHGAESRAEAARLLNLVGLSNTHLDRYPYELSGGQRQRAGLARAMASRPDLIVLDEPASALDVSTQAQVVNLLRDMQAATGVAYVLIAHDLHLVHHVCHRIAVMYLGKIVEIGPADRVIHAPLHPYTQALIRSIPKPLAGSAPPRLELPGEIPSPTNVPSGCRFRTRCGAAWDLCARVEPGLTGQPDGSVVACHLHAPGPAGLPA
jgi:peptide/nickel transport system ATP-binding protein